MKKVLGSFKNINLYIIYKSYFLKNYSFYVEFLVVTDRQNFNLFFFFFALSGDVFLFVSKVRFIPRTKRSIVSNQV